MKRRQLFTALSMAALGAGCAPPPGAQAEALPGASPRPPTTYADPAAYRLAGEFEPMAAMWLGYDEGHAPITAALAAALQPHVRLKMWLAEKGQLDAAERMLRQAGVKVDAVQFHVDPLAIFFVRDSAVFALPREKHHGLGVLGFKWSQYGLATWCQRRHPSQPAEVAECTGELDPQRDLMAAALGKGAAAAPLRTPLALEGGGLEVNGQGLALVSEPLVMSRNPGVPRAALQQYLLALPGVRKLIWLADGLASDPHLRGTIVGNYVAWGTGGHTDEFVRFADTHTVLLAWPDEAELATHPVARLNRQRMQRNFEILSRSTAADGRPLKVLRVPLPRSVERRVFLSAAADTRFSAGWTAKDFPTRERRREGQPVIQVASSSYLNHVVANGVVVVPGYEAHGTPRAQEQRVRAIYEQAFAGRRVVFIDALGLNWVGGGPHCATLNEPALV